MDLNNVQNRGCRTFQNGVCIECSLRFFPNTEGVCQEVDPTVGSGTRIMELATSATEDLCFRQAAV